MEINTRALRSQVQTLVEAFWRRAENAFGPRVLANFSTQGIVANYMNRLTMEGELRQGGACVEIINSILDPSELSSETFWRTPLGRLIAWQIGYPGPRVSIPIVAAILGTSRQYVHSSLASGGVEVEKNEDDGRVYADPSQFCTYLRRRRGAIIFT